jgi:hypothetical protein
MSSRVLSVPSIETLLAAFNLGIMYSVADILEPGKKNLYEIEDEINEKVGQYDEDFVVCGKLIHMGLI